MTRRAADPRHLIGAPLAAAMLGLCACDPGVFDALVGDEAGAPAPSPSPVMEDRSPVMEGTPPAMEATPRRGRDAGAERPSDGPPDVAEEDAGRSPPEEAPCPVARDAQSVAVRTREFAVFPRAASADYWLGMASATVGTRVVWLFHRPTDAVAVWGDARDFRADPPRFDVPQVAASLWPMIDGGGSPLTGGVVARDEHEALIFFAAYEGWNARAAGLARIALDAERATALRAPGELFGELSMPVTGAGFNPVFYAGPFLDTSSSPSFVYVFACQPKPGAMDEQPGGAHPQPCRIARVAAGEVERGASYRFWDGAQWTAERMAAVPVIDQVHGGVLTVSHNRYLGRYLAVHSAAGDRVLLRHATAPQGPWLMLGEFPTEPAMGGFGSTHSALEHSALRETCDTVTYVSYARPVETAQDAGVQTAYESRLVRVELQ